MLNLKMYNVLCCLPKASPSAYPSFKCRTSRWAYKDQMCNQNILLPCICICWVTCQGSITIFICRMMNLGRLHQTFFSFFLPYRRISTVMLQSHSLSFCVACTMVNWLARCFQMKSTQSKCIEYQRIWIGSNILTWYHTFMPWLETAHPNPDAMSGCCIMQKRNSQDTILIQSGN